MANINFACSLLTLWLIRFVLLWWKTEEKTRDGSRKTGRKQRKKRAQRESEWKRERECVYASWCDECVVNDYNDIDNDYSGEQNRTKQNRTENKLIFIFYRYVSSERHIPQCRRIFPHFEVLTWFPSAFQNVSFFIPRVTLYVFFSLLLRSFHMCEWVLDFSLFFRFNSHCCL